MEELYTPGAGHLPPNGELPGRENVLAGWSRTIALVNAQGRSRAQDLVFTGYRGVGKTVTMKSCAQIAQNAGYVVLPFQANPDVTLAAAVREAATQAAKQGPAMTGWEHTLDVLHRISGASMGAAGVSASITTRPPDPQAPADPYNSSALGGALADLADSIAEHQHQRGGVLLCVDELQMASPNDVRTLGAMLNYLNNWRESSHVAFLATGLPSTDQAMIGDDPDKPLISNPSRLFRMMPLPQRLRFEEAEAALRHPAWTRGADWAPEAVAMAYDATGGYPAHLQALAHYSWLAAPGPIVQAVDVQAGMGPAQADVREQYMGARWDKLSPAQQAYVTALSLAGGQARSGQLAAMLGKASSTEVSKLRDTLVSRGDIYPVRGGWVALAQPMMGDYAPIAYQYTLDDNPELPRLEEMAARRDTYADGRTRPQQPHLTAEQIQQLKTPGSAVDLPPAAVEARRITQQSQQSRPREELEINPAPPREAPER